MNNQTSNHQRYEPLYRSRNGMVLGVCKGLSLKFAISVFWLRVIIVVSAFLTAFFPVIILYTVMALLLRPEPSMEFRNEEDLDFYMTYTTSKKLALSRLNREYKSLEDRVRRMESMVTDKEFNWEQRLRSGN